MNSCLSSDECPFFHECLSNLCQHKDLLPFTLVEILTLFLLCFTSIISTVGGAGGGVFFFPIIMAILKIEPKEAIAISLTSVAGILAIRYSISIPERHMRRNRPMINYDISIIYCPSIIIGTIFGVLINRASPNWFLLTLVSFSMGFTFWETWKKAKSFRLGEQANDGKPVVEYANLNDIELNYINKINTFLETPDDNQNRSPSNTSKTDESSIIPKEKIRYSELEQDVTYIEPEKNLTKSFLRKCEKSLRMILEEEARVLPSKKLSILLINLFCLTFFICMTGNKNTHSLIGIEYCGFWYWVFQFVYIPFGLAILYYSVKLLNKEFEEKVNSGYLFLPCDIKWDKNTSLNSIFIGILIGFLAAILGIGGSIIAGPVMLKMGFHPQEATYTASFMATFTAIASSFQYVVVGMVKWDYTLMCFFAGVFGLFVGMNYVMRYIKKKNKASLIIYCLAICIGFSTLVLVFTGFEKTIQDFKYGRVLKLKEIC